MYECVQYALIHPEVDQASFWLYPHYELIDTDQRTLGVARQHVIQRRHEDKARCRRVVTLAPPTWLSLCFHLEPSDPQNPDQIIFQQTEFVIFEVQKSA